MARRWSSRLEAGSMTIAEAQIGATVDALMPIYRADWSGPLQSPQRGRIVAIYLHDDREFKVALDAGFPIFVEETSLRDLELVRQ